MMAGPGGEEGRGRRGRHAGAEGGRHGGKRGSRGGRGGDGRGPGSAGPGGGRRGGGRQRLLDGETLRLIVLLLLEDGARHGYDLIKAVEAMADGHYSPSPGVIYPALTYLSEADLIVAREEGSKKIYELTEAGIAHLAERRAAAEAAMHALEAIGKRMAQKDMGQGLGGDRDIAGAVPELNAARRALKRTMAAEMGKGEEAQRRLAERLQALIAEFDEEDGDDIDL